MSLSDKILKIYPQLNRGDFDVTLNGTILLQNDSDGNGDYIKKWEHPSLAKPTQDQLDAV